MAVPEERFSGRTFKHKELALIRELVQDCAGLSRMELARTVCELLRWKRPNGSLKARECREYLEQPFQGDFFRSLRSLAVETCGLTFPQKSGHRVRRGASLEGEVFNGQNEGEAEGVQRGVQS